MELSNKPTYLASNVSEIQFKLEFTFLSYYTLIIKIVLLIKHVTLWITVFTKRSIIALTLMRVCQKCVLWQSMLVFAISEKTNKEPSVIAHHQGQSKFLARGVL